jgi:hypothetical protein
MSGKLRGKKERRVRVRVGAIGTERVTGRVTGTRKRGGTMGTRMIEGIEGVRVIGRDGEETTGGGTRTFGGDLTDMTIDTPRLLIAGMTIDSLSIQLIQETLTTGTPTTTATGIDLDTVVDLVLLVVKLTTSGLTTAITNRLETIPLSLRPRGRGTIPAPTSHARNDKRELIHLHLCGRVSENANRTDRDHVRGRR